MSNNLTQNLRLGVLLSAIIFVVLLALVLLLPILQRYFTVSNKNEASIEHSRAIEALHPYVDPKFLDDTMLWGLFHTHSQESNNVSDIKDVLGPGLCIGDINGDQLDDLVFTNGSGDTRNYGRQSWWLNHQNIIIYINNNGQHFDLLPVTLNIPSSVATMGCALVDLNQDKLNDLVISSYEGSYLFQNINGLEFKLIGEFSNIADKHWNTGIAVLDVNQDNLPDLYLSHYIRYRKNQNTLELDSGFNHGKMSRFDPKLYDGTANQLLINKGEFHFEDASTQYFSSQDQDRTLNTIVADLNQDQLDDLLILNDAGSPARVYWQTPQSTFREEADLLSPFKVMAASYAALGNYNDILISRPGGLGLSYLEYNVKSPQIKSPTGKSIYSDTSWEKGINKTEYLSRSVWGTQISDLNLDGLDDIFMVTGLRMQDAYAPKRSIGQSDMLLTQSSVGYKHVKDFTELHTSSSARSVGISDFNLDGLPDLIIANNNAVPRLLINASNAVSPWVSIKSTLASPVTLTIEQDDWQTTRILRTETLYLGTQQSFHSLALPQEKEFTVKVNDKLSHKLKPNTHYVYNGEAFTEVSLSSQKRSLDIAFKDEPVFLQKARIYQAHNNTSGPLDSNYLLAISKLLDNNLNSDAIIKFILNQPEKIEMLPYYLSWAESGDNNISTNSWAAIKNLESDNSVEYLTPLIENATPKQMCALADIFSYWYNEEEAAIKTKYLAVPHFIRALNGTDVDSVACAAEALGHSEHLTASAALLEAYTLHNDIKIRLAIVQALGLVRQTSAENFLSKAFQQTSKGALKVEIAIALNRLTPNSGDNKLITFYNNTSADEDRVANKWEQQADIIANLQDPEKRIHINTKTIAAIEKSIKLHSKEFYSKIDHLNIKSQLAIANLLDIKIASDKLFNLIYDADYWFSPIETRIRKGLTPSSENLYALLNSERWAQLPGSLQKLILNSLTDSAILEHIQQDPFRRNLISSIDLLSAGKSLSALKALNQTSLNFDLEDANYCHSPANIDAPDSAFHDMPLNNGIVAAQLTLGKVKSLSPPTLKDLFVDTLAGLPLPQKNMFFRCLANLRIDEEIHKKLGVVILGLPEELEQSKQAWLIFSVRAESLKDNTLINSGVESRLKRKNEQFADALLSQTEPQNLSNNWIELFSFYPHETNAFRFSQLFNKENIAHR